jgi:hypothetical protein
LGRGAGERLMGRPPLPLGTWGKIRTYELPDVRVARTPGRKSRADESESVERAA